MEKYKLSKCLNKSIGRFLIVGGISTGIDFILYYYLSNFVTIAIAKIISMCVASIISFFINKNWTFLDKGKNSVQKVMKYAIVQIVNISVNTLVNSIIFVLTGRKIVAFIIATSFAMCINYLLQRMIVFRKEKE